MFTSYAEICTLSTVFTLNDNMFYGQVPRIFLNHTITEKLKNVRQINQGRSNLFNSS